MKPGCHNIARLEGVLALADLGRSKVAHEGGPSSGKCGRGLPCASYRDNARGGYSRNMQQDLSYTGFAKYDLAEGDTTKLERGAQGFLLDRMFLSSSQLERFTSLYQL